MIKPDNIEGYVLAGGLSRRMGTAKGLLVVEGTTILEHVTAILARVVPEISIVTDRPEEVAFLGRRIVPDIFKAAGPLGGLHAALSVTSAPSILLVSCDLPFLTVDLLHHLVECHGPAPVTVAMSDRAHPLCAVYDQKLLSLAELRLRSGQRSMMGFIDAAGYLAVDLSELKPRVDPKVLMNVNTPEDLDAARVAAR